MPLYEFECQACHYRFETLVRNAAACSEVTCRQCRSPKVTKLISAPSPGTPGSSPTFSSAGASCPTNSPFR